MSKNDGWCFVDCYIFMKYMPTAVGKPNLVAVPITSQELKGQSHVT